MGCRIQAQANRAVCRVQPAVIRVESEPKGAEHQVQSAVMGVESEAKGAEHRVQPAVMGVKSEAKGAECRAQSAVKTAECWGQFAAGSDAKGAECWVQSEAKEAECWVQSEMKGAGRQMQVGSNAAVASSAPRSVTMNTAVVVRKGAQDWGYYWSSNWGSISATGHHHRPPSQLQCSLQG